MPGAAPQLVNTRLRKTLSKLFQARNPPRETLEGDSLRQLQADDDNDCNGNDDKTR